MTHPSQNKPPEDLRTFLEQLRAAGELIDITEPVSPHLEITEIADRVSKSQGMANKALLFHHVIGYDMPVLINAMGSHQRMLMGLGVPLEGDPIQDYGHIQRRIESYIKPDIMHGGGLWEKLAMLPKLADLNNIFPRKFKGAVAPCQEVVITDPSQPMLDKIPVLTCWPQDGGPFVTMPIVIVKEPGGARNVGMYRLQKYDNVTTGMHWHKHHDGNRIYENARAAGKDRVEVAVALGCAPHIIYAATAPLPPGIDELLFAGFLHNKPVSLVPCKTIDLDVPAHAEIILEGYVLLDEKRWEGPFGDHTGYYSLADDYPVFHVTAVTHRRDPLYLTTIVGKPPQEDCYLGKATERIFLPLLKLFISEIVDMNLPWEGVFHNCVILSIDKRFPGHAKKVMSSLWGFGQLMFSKYVVVVDKHVDVQNLSEVAWHVFNNTDPRRDMMFADGPLDILDHATPLWGYGSKVGIDATKKWESEGFTRQWPDEIEMSDDVKAQVTARWATLFANSSK
ncbi:MAG: menaquinone biosynthesis decarboxylase [Vampirovibrionales bacterium]|nr:menaquinone biosynthesis decarboxylase [Vampirovibrionales bacterium]